MEAKDDLTECLQMDALPPSPAPVSMEQSMVCDDSMVMCESPTVGMPPPPSPIASSMPPVPPPSNTDQQPEEEPEEDLDEDIDCMDEDGVTPTTENETKTVPDLTVVAKAVPNMSHIARYEQWLEQKATKAKEAKFNPSKGNGSAAAIKGHAEPDPGVIARLTKQTAASSGMKRTRSISPPAPAGRRSSVGKAHKGIQSKLVARPAIKAATTIREQAKPVLSKAPKEVLTSEEREVREAAIAQAKIHAQIAANMKSHSHNKHAGFSTDRSTKTLTVPESPAMITKARYGVKKNPEAGLLREGEGSVQSSVAEPLTLTQPLPFKLSTETRANGNGRGAPAKAGSTEPTLAEAIFKLQTSVPERFMTLAPGSKPRESLSTAFTGKLTVPQAPVLHESSRNRSADVEGLQKKKEEELKEATKRQFKARPFNAKMMHSAGLYGVPKVQARTTTSAAPFHLSGPASKPAVASKEKETKQFKARPMPRSVSRPPASVPREQKKLTIAQSPAFKSTHRPRAVHRENASKEENSEPKPNTKATGSRGLTEPKPFNLATSVRGSIKQQSLNRKNEGEMEALRAQADAFKARSMPDFSEVGFLPTGSEKELTEFKEFKLAGAAQHAKATAQFENKVQTELAEERRLSEVHARPVPSSTYRSFEVKHPDRSPLKVQDPNLKSSTRAMMRKCFDEQNKERVTALAAEKKAQIEERLKEEQAKLQRLRRTSIEDGGLQFVAKAPLKCAAFMPVPSDAALTVPQTPKFNVSSARTSALAEDRDQMAMQGFRAKPMPNFGACLSPGRVPVNDN